MVEVNPVTRSQIKFSEGYKKVQISEVKVFHSQMQVPILRTAAYEQPLVESSLIVSMLATFLVRPELSLPEIPPLYPEHTTKDAKTGKEGVEHFNQYFVMWGETPLSGKHIHDARFAFYL